MVYLGNVSLQWNRNQSLLSLFLIQAPSVHFCLAFFSSYVGQCTQRTVSWKHLTALLTDLQKSLWEADTAELAGRHQMLSTLWECWGWLFNHKSLTLIKFILLQLLVLCSNQRIRKSLGVFLLQYIFVHSICVGLVKVWEELQSSIYSGYSGLTGDMFMMSLTSLGRVL